MALKAEIVGVALDKGAKCCPGTDGSRIYFLRRVLQSAISPVLLHYNYPTAWVKAVRNTPCTRSAHLLQVSTPFILHLRVWYFSEC